MPQKPLLVSVSGGLSHPAANGCVAADARVGSPRTEAVLRTRFDYPWRDLRNSKIGLNDHPFPPDQRLLWCLVRHNGVDYVMTQKVRCEEAIETPNHNCRFYITNTQVSNFIF